MIGRDCRRGRGSAQQAQVHQGVSGQGQRAASCGPGELSPHRRPRRIERRYGAVKTPIARPPHKATPGRWKNTAFASTVKLFSGREMPYATIQYIWENKLPKETVLDNAKTSRAKMLVVESGPQRLGQWINFERNVEQDYERLFGEPPGAIIFVGVMTDSNATGSQTSAYYGDIRFSRE